VPSVNFSTSCYDRTTEAARCLRAGRWEQLGQLVYASHASLRDDYAVSCEELDVVVELARSIGLAGGVFGARMTGGGFGGCAVALVKADQAKSICQKIGEGYQTRTGKTATGFVSRPCAGASLVG
jgi:galactokinase